MVTDEDITLAQTRINHWPKKWLWFKQYVVIFQRKWH